MSAIKQLPEIARIEGISLLPTGDPKAASVTLQYTDQKHEWHELKMPLMDSLHLLYLLSGMVKEQKLESLLIEASKRR